MNAYCAGICIEDKLFPKTNSLLDDGKQRLADVEEFSLKIKVSDISNTCSCDNTGKPWRGVHVTCISYIFVVKLLQACKETQRDPDFCVVARVEAFIAGHGLDEALQRAEAYRNAGKFPFSDTFAFSNAFVTLLSNIHICFAILFFPQEQMLYLCTVKSLTQVILNAL